MSEATIVKNRLEEIVLSHESILASLTPWRWQTHGTPAAPSQTHTQTHPPNNAAVQVEPPYESELEATFAQRKNQTLNPPFTVTSLSIVDLD